MTIKLYAFTCGTVTGEFAHLMEGGEGDITVPVPVFLIEHPKGRALFDTGLHPDCQHEPAGRLGERLAGLFRIGFQPGEEVTARLQAIDRDPGKIDLIINSQAAALIQPRFEDSRNCHPAVHRIHMPGDHPRFLAASSTRHFFIRREPSSQ